MSEVKLMKKIGQGAFGTVYMGDRKGKQCAVKVIPLSGVASKISQDAIKEGKLLEKLQHPNIVKCEGCHEVKWEHGSELHIIMEYCGGGDLFSNIKKQRATGCYFPEHQIMSWFLDINKAVEYLHSKGVIHRDIKPLNILRHNDGKIKLGDFGLAKILSSKKDLKASVLGTIIYASPELYLKSVCDYRGDMWSLGCTLYELAKLEPAFRSGSEMIKYIKDQNCLKAIPVNYSDNLRTLIQSLIQVNPSKRPTAADIAKCITHQGAINNGKRVASKCTKEQDKSPKKNITSPKEPVKKREKVRKDVNKEPNQPANRREKSPGSIPPVDEARENQSDIPVHKKNAKPINPNKPKQPIIKVCHPGKDKNQPKQQMFPEGYSLSPLINPGLSIEPFQCFQQEFVKDAMARQVRYVGGISPDGLRKLFHEL